METAILLAVAASLCTATSSVCQRMGAKSSRATGFDARLMFRSITEFVTAPDTAA